MDESGCAHGLSRNEKNSLSAGSFSQELTLEDIYGMILEGAQEAVGADVTILSSGKDGTYVAVLCLREDEEEVEEALRKGGFSDLPS